MASAKQKRIVQATKDDDEDISTILIADEPNRHKVNRPLLWSFDAVCFFLATMYTHSEWDIVTRLATVAGLIMTSWVIQYFYFTSGLDRPNSGELPIDKWWHTAIAHCGNTVFFWQWAVAVYNQFAYWVEQETNVFLVAIYIAASIYALFWLSDVAAGLVHWFGDSTDLYFFQYHHKDSRYMTRQSYVHHCWDSIALAMAASFVFPSLSYSAFFATFRLMVVQTNECHMWAHCTSKEIPGFIKVLQDLTFVLSWKSHRVHHTPPHLVDYCVFNGWANPFMNVILPGFATNTLNKLRDSKAFQSLQKALDA